MVERRGDEAGHRVIFVKDIFLSGQFWRMDLVTTATET